MAPTIERSGLYWKVRTTCGVYQIPNHVPILSVEYKFDSIRVRWDGGDRWVYHGSRWQEREKLYDLLVEHLFK